MMQERFRLWNPLRPFDGESIGKYVPDCAQGVYAIYCDGVPFYAGRSLNNVKGRLLCHLRGTGNRNVWAAVIRQRRLQFTFAELMSFEQFEALLISALGGTGRLGNLRNETDPADKFGP